MRQQTYKLRLTEIEELVDSYGRRWEGIGLERVSLASAKQPDRGSPTTNLLTSCQCADASRLESDEQRRCPDRLRCVVPRLSLEGEMSQQAADSGPIAKGLLARLLLGLWKSPWMVLGISLELCIPTSSGSRVRPSLVTPGDISYVAMRHSVEPPK